MILEAPYELLVGKFMTIIYYGGFYDFNIFLECEGNPQAVLEKLVSILRIW